MINISVIGMTGTGKTRFVKRFIKNRKAFVFDVNDEYKEFTTDTKRSISRMVDLDHKLFLEIALSKKNTCNVFEDATGFVEGRLSDEFRKLLVSKRHTGNTNIVLFHSVLSVPPRMIQLSDYIVLFNTNDEFKNIVNKYPSIADEWAEVRNNSERDKHYHKFIKMT